MATAIEMPTVGGVQKNLMSYGAGLVAGLGYNIVSNITGSGLIGGAVSAAVAGSLVKGVMGEVIAVSAGFNQGARGMGALGLGNGTGMFGLGSFLPGFGGERPAAPDKDLLLTIND